MDMSKYRDHPEDGKYALELVDVYSRKAFTQSIPDKSAATVSRAFDTLKTEARAQPNAVVTTDMGGEIANLKGIVHRTKDPASTNGIAVADRTMQTLKKLAVSRVASTGDDWNEALDKATDQYNKRPNLGEPIPAGHLLKWSSTNDGWTSMERSRWASFRQSRGSRV